MLLNFLADPTIDDTHVAGLRFWTWTGTTQSMNLINMGSHIVPRLS